ncbi:MAG: 30S ribosomal protein S4e [Candidatus Methanofastidiosia archaeon]|jgi:small subunit ribosomal protein S4e
MARKGQKKGLKRSKAPKQWRIARKEKKWTINPHPGPHNKEAIPLAFIIRDHLGYAHNLREVKRILNERKVTINGIVRTDYRFPVGILDVVEIPVTKECYRILPDVKGIPILVKITGEETHMRPLKIVKKQYVNGGKTQLGFHDGTTVILDEPAEYIPQGTVLHDFKSGSILGYFSLTKGNYAMIMGGSNVSQSGNIASITDTMVEIHGKNDHVYRTLKENVFVLGLKESAISLGD